MSRKEINVFGTSFLDLLSGALAAVIILYVIVPKMSQTEREALDELQQMNVQVDELSEQLQALRDMIPQDTYRALVDQVEQMQQTMQQLEESIAALQDDNARLTADNERLQSEVERLRHEAARADSLQRRIEQLEQQQQRQQQQQRRQQQEAYA